MSAVSALLCQPNIQTTPTTDSVNPLALWLTAHPTNYRLFTLGHRETPDKDAYGVSDDHSVSNTDDGRRQHRVRTGHDGLLNMPEFTGDPERLTDFLEAASAAGAHLRSVNALLPPEIFNNIYGILIRKISHQVRAECGITGSTEAAEVARLSERYVGDRRPTARSAVKLLMMRRALGARMAAVEAAGVATAKLAVIEEFIRETVLDLAQGIIRKSVSTYCSPLWVVPKNPDAQGNPCYRVVVDFKQLNKYTRSEKYPLPRLEEILDRMNGATVFSLLDLKAGYHQIRMHEADCEKTAFQFGRGKYEFTRMPFGLRNAPTTFQRLMDEFLEGLNEDAIQVYVDDIIVFSRSEQEHGRHLGQLLHMLKEV
ncbi:hypothetical protein AAG570_000891 [Ranatra chinensis]|uniref:Reverse transcriptase domain-containing protein n=1 Tax=Ranatra chinensis TaxID=642074 RepID=A0ABD0YYP7_9HEMI